MTSPWPPPRADDGPRKVVAIKCSTRDAADKAYAPYNRQLYDLLQYHQRVGNAPSLEPSFVPFDVSAALSCGANERTMGELSRCVISRHLHPSSLCACI